MVYQDKLDGFVRKVKRGTFYRSKVTTIKFINRIGTGNISYVFTIDSSPAVKTCEIVFANFYHLSCTDQWRPTCQSEGWITGRDLNMLRIP